MYDELQQNISRVLDRVNAAGERRARITGDKRPIKVIAATKTVEPARINALIACGVKTVGENRVQEYLAKKDAVSGAEWHFIGTLQRNKAKYLVGAVSLIQSVSSASLALEIDRLARSRGVTQDVLVEINAGGEESKTGAPEESADELIALVRSLGGVKLRGLMAVPPIGADGTVYDKMFELYSRYAGGEFDTLSIGMSGDYEKAIEHGSNMVRIGTALFGKRN